MATLIFNANWIAGVIYRGLLKDDPELNGEVKAQVDFAANYVAGLSVQSGDDVYLITIDRLPPVEKR